MYVTDLGMIERPVYDGLVAFRATGGLASVGLVPDLATEIPTPTEGHTRYTFTIRPNIRFSSGQTVQASDIRRGLIRELTVGRVNGQPKFYQAIKGAKACLANPKHCDLTDGVIVDNANRRITFKLDEPDPTFLYKLTFFVYATPPARPRPSPVCRLRARALHDFRVQERYAARATAKSLLQAMVVRGAARRLPRRDPLYQGSKYRRPD
jgi:peptide/nickel transport system substrate-binding protein